MVLLPCGKCCDQCTCNSCQCCECDGGIPGDTATTAAARWTRFMSGKLSTAAADEVAEDLPCVPGISGSGRYVSPRSYDRIADLLPDCQIERRWESQAACVDALIAGEVAAIVAAGEPYQWDPWYGWCRETFTGQKVTVEATFGSGAEASVTKQAECKITEITVSKGGSGYARYARIAPTLTIAGGSGTAATFTPTLASSGSPAAWSLASATASGGSGYVDGESLTITAATGDTVATAAKATVTARGTPTLTATGSGSGAEFSITLSQSGSPPTWAVSKVAVTKAGSGYSHQSSLTFSAGTGVAVTAAKAAVQTLEEPSFTVDASGAGGSGAAFSISYAPADGTYWEITGIDVTDGGSGYSAGGTVTLSPGTGDYVGIWPEGTSEPLELAYTVSGGAIESVTGFEGYGFYRDRGQVQAVSVGSGGSYYGTTGAAYGVTVTAGGSYYREDKSGTPETASLTIYTTNKAAAGNFSGTIDDDTGSATFGQITAIEFTGSGSGNQPLLPTPTSALEVDERQKLLDAWCAGAPSSPYTSGFWEPLSQHAAVEFSDADEVEEKIGELFGAAGAMDAAALYKGYCSERTLVGSGGYLLGWSTPYRKGFPLTPARMADLCDGGLPWKKQPSETYPAVFEAWGVAVFANDTVPPVRAITLIGSTGDDVIDRLLETGTRGKAVVEAELDDPLTDYSKTVTFESRDGCDDVNVDDVNYEVPPAGEKWIKIAASTLDDGDPVNTWELNIAFRPCEPRSNLPPTGNPGPFVAEYSLTVTDHATSTTTDITDDMIEDTLAFKPYASEADCQAADLRADALCLSGAWEVFGADAGLEMTCCYGYATDDDEHDE